MKPSFLTKQDDLPSVIADEEGWSYLERIKTFNEVKKIILRSSTEDEEGKKVINIRLFAGLVHEIRLRLRVEYYRAKNNDTPEDEKIATMIQLMQDYSLINPVKILNALNVAD